MSGKSNFLNSSSPSGTVGPLKFDGRIGSSTGTLFGLSCLHFAVGAKPLGTFSGAFSCTILQIVKEAVR